ncbi:endonuclease/exonuclease/phosphatase family protein [Kriegella aquimaris]|uniref:Metal-dependent hydrolase, endonuclease/exonuclease/phosphatase family n=1 Tax=Kriegella aquimaris TaxID=192904 RepID=A0A1G9JXL5_9FLAO|nr:endonuclease/exonuclease/phosphatase family protein [Kriegella aquimaris]SDL41956.1 Metal-dependent hydrolase, endonuclease/exonuclease/phosphatase family [Kriegella aquimaris]
MLLSLSILVLGYLTMGAFVKFDFSDKKNKVSPDLRVLSYNVRTFNKDGHIDSPRVFEDIKDLVDSQDPDIVCFQEVGYLRRKEYVNYPYKHLEFIKNGGHLLLGIFSKYPIIDAQLLNFPKSYNNGAYADILFKNDTIRIYDLHLESLGITPGTGVLRSEASDKLYRRVTGRFKKQEEQAKLVREHMQTVDYKTIICGDFNNTQFSNVYHIIKGDRQDTFIEEGNGLGRTYDFLGIPLRIDFIFADNSFEVLEHKNFNVKYSDHFPVMASFRIKGD